MSQAGLRTAAIDELRTFCTAAELGSLGRAALSLHVSQPALSKRLAHLEAAAGTQLLERSPRGVKLTPSGHRLYEEARRLLKQAERVQEVITGLQRSGGPVRLASSHSATEALVGDLLGQLNETARPACRARHRQLQRRPRPRRRRARGPRRGGQPPQRHPIPRREGNGARRGRCRVCRALHTPMGATAEHKPGGVPAHANGDARPVFQRALDCCRGPARARADRCPPLIEAGTPQATIREARARNAPLLLSRQVLVGHDFHELEIEQISFPRQFVLVLPAYGEPIGQRPCPDREAASSSHHPVSGASPQTRRYRIALVMVLITNGHELRPMKGCQAMRLRLRSICMRVCPLLPVPRLGGDVD